MRKGPPNRAASWSKGSREEIEQQDHDGEFNKNENVDASQVPRTGGASSMTALTDASADGSEPCICGLFATELRCAHSLLSLRCAHHIGEQAIRARNAGW